MLIHMRQLSSMSNQAYITVLDLTGLSWVASNTLILFVTFVTETMEMMEMMTIPLMTLITQMTLVTLVTLICKQ